MVHGDRRSGNLRTGRGWERTALVVAALLASLRSVPSAAQDEPLPFQRTEIREPCADYDPLKRPFFGDTHVHTSYSIDSFVFDVRNDPAMAYEYARGAELRLPPLDENGVGTRTTRLRRPIDFAMVSDHAEGFGPLHVCMTPGAPGYDAVECRMLRNETPMPPAGSLAVLIATVSVVPPLELPMCHQPGVDCDVVPMWEETQAAAEAAYDRTSACRFTTFVGYEWTPMPGTANLHRNVVFRNERVPSKPIDYFETQTFEASRLWELLAERCLDRDSGELTETTGCDVLTIPHGMNTSAGLMFPDPLDAREAAARAFFEPLAEIYQHKGASECRWDSMTGMGTDTTDEQCAFELNSDVTLFPLLGYVPVVGAGLVPSPAFPRRSFVRNVLKDGLAIERRLGVNPFKLGLIASTDNHNGTPGNTDEKDWPGHSGINGESQSFGPGGLAVVWAEENSRDSLFAAMRRRETYGTSGTRPVVRFFGGWDYPADLCGRADLVEVGYERGVPMGGDLPPATGEGAPRFVVAAAMDPGVEDLAGNRLQEAQIVKGWVDALGQVHEKVFRIAGGPPDRAANPETCEPGGPGVPEICTVWTDPEFDATQGAFYYLRVLESPSCHWATWQEPGPGKEVIQERAWTSPIWYRPG